MDRSGPERTDAVYYRSVPEDESEVRELEYPCPVGRDAPPGAGDIADTVGDDEQAVVCPAIEKGVYLVRIDDDETFLRGPVEDQDRERSFDAAGERCAAGGIASKDPRRIESVAACPVIWISEDEKIRRAASRETAGPPFIGDCLDA